MKELTKMESHIDALSHSEKMSYVTVGEENLFTALVKTLYNKGMTEHDIQDQVMSALSCASKLD